MYKKGNAEWKKGLPVTEERKKKMRESQKMRRWKEKIARKKEAAKNEA